MTYQAKRKQHYTETLELVDEIGTVRHSVVVDLDPGVVAENLSRKYTELIRVKREADAVDQKNPESLVQAYQNLGDAVMGMIEAVFGTENANVIFAFYGERYNEMLVEVMPFVNDVVIPEVRRLAKESKHDALQKYNQKQRRFFQK